MRIEFPSNSNCSLKTRSNRLMDRRAGGTPCNKRSKGIPKPTTGIIYSSSNVCTIELECTYLYFHEYYACKLD